MEDKTEITQRQDENRQEPKERQDKTVRKTKTVERQKHDQTRLDITIQHKMTQDGIRQELESKLKKNVKGKEEGS